MKCSGCGAEMPETAKTCAACGREVGIGHQAAGETMHLAKETEAAAEKVGKGLWSGAKAMGSSAKKGLKRVEGEKKEE
jgi:hypothetical protein